MTEYVVGLEVTKRSSMLGLSPRRSGIRVGPFPFAVYVNDMQEHFNDCTLIQFADDTQFLHRAPLQDLHTLVKNVETTLSRAVSYFS